MPKNPQQQQISTTSTTAPKQNTFFRTDFYNSESLMKFIKSVTVRNKNTARQYHLRLSLFAKFIEEKYKIDLDEFLQQLKRQGGV